MSAVEPNFPEQLFSLAQLDETLRAESQTTGRAQTVLFKRGNVRMLLFYFQNGSELAQHAVNGVAIIHALEGHLTVQTSAKNHVLRAGEVLILEPKVAHDVKALADSRMLLTVHLEEKSP